MLLLKIGKIISQCSLGQHYTVFYHKRRSYFTSLCCGVITTILYIFVLFYAVTRFKSIFDRAEYDVVEEYKPLSLNQEELTFDTFIDTSELVIQFIRPWETVYYKDCSELYAANVTLISSNPDGKLAFTLTNDFTEIP